MSPRQTNAGFSLIEMILIVAVMGILVTLSFGTITEFLDRQNVNTENIQLEEIRRALTAYSMETGTMPVDNSGGTPASLWYDELADYSNLSANQIRFDSWNNERIYKAAMTVERFRETDISVNYATIYSMGSNRIVDSSSTIVPTVVTTGMVDENPSGVGAAVWWSQTGDPKTQFGAFDTIDDDMAIKFTDLNHKTALYEEARTRIQAISQALQNYADAKINEALVQNVADVNAGVSQTYTVENLIFFPRTEPRSGDGADNAFYASNVAGEVDTFIGDGDAVFVIQPAGSTFAGGVQIETADSIDASDADATRLADMQELMRMLGLPDAYCCNPLDIRFDATDNRYEAPFYYFSNPRPRAAGNSCGTRPGAPPYLPPRITVTVTPTGGTDLPTCG